jgi:hypothetical protein
MCFNFFEYDAQAFQIHTLNLSGELLHLIGLSYLVASALIVSIPLDFILYLGQIRNADSQKKLLTPQLFAWAENPSGSLHEQHHLIALSLLPQIGSMIAAISLNFTSAGITFLILWALAYILFLIGERLSDYLNPFTTSLPAQI